MKTKKREYNFSPILGDNIQDCIKRVKYNKASLIIIDGPIGEGKTTLGVLVADYINNLYGFPKIIYNEQVALGGEDFQSKLRICYDKSYPCIVYDEAGDFNRRGALTRFNMQLNRTFETFRAFKIIPILCLPLFSVIDSDLFRKGIPRLLLHLKGRTNKIGYIYGYSLYRMYYLRHKIEKIVVDPQAFSFTDPNFHAHFWNLEPERAKELDKYTTEGKLSILEKSEMDQKGLVSGKQLAKRFNVTSGHIRTLRVKFGLDPAMKVKQFHYYSGEQVKLFEDYFNSPKYKG